MKVLFVMNTPGFLRYFDATVEELLDRGHQVHLAFTRPDMRAEALEVLGDRPGLVVQRTPAPRRADRYAELAEALRATADYVRYLDPRFAAAGFLRNRRRVRVLQVAPLARPLVTRDTLPAGAVRLLLSALRAAERAVPSAAEVEEHLRAVSPDVVLVSPLVTGASPQTDQVKSARALGVPSGVCVASWDNLTNKGLLRVLPDRVIVWNDAQRREALALHGVPEVAVCVTGAQPFDRWFGREPSTSREAFCEKVGLDPRLPFVLFTGSTSNIAKQGVEERWVGEWIAALRAGGDPQVRAAGLLVRPHPDRPGRWDDVALSDSENIALWPPVRPNSVTAQARTDYFDSLHHAAAVVGINTSAMVEAAVIGRPVLTVRAPQFVEAQAGTLHFEHLLPEHGGPVRAAATLSEHARQLGDALREPAPFREANERFVRAFIRPHGLERPCTPILADAIEALGDAGRSAAIGAQPAIAAPLRGGVWLVAAIMHAGARHRDAGARARWSARSARLRARSGRSAPPARPVLRACAAAADAIGAGRAWSASRAHAKRKARAAGAKRRAAQLTGAAPPEVTGSAPASARTEAPETHPVRARH